MPSPKLARRAVGDNRRKDVFFFFFCPKRTSKKAWWLVVSSDDKAEDEGYWDPASVLCDPAVRTMMKMMIWLAMSSSSSS